MKRHISGLIALVWLLSPHGAATASLTATIVDGVGDPNSLVLTGGATFNVTIALNTTEPLTALQMKLTENILQGNSPSGLFTLNSVSFINPPWSLDGGLQLDPSPQALNAGNSYTTDDIGDLPEDWATGTGEFDFATLSITLSSPTLGATYYLNLTDIVYGDENFADQFGTAGVNYEVQVVPAPGAMILGIIGLSMVAWVRRLRAAG